MRALALAAIALATATAPLAAAELAATPRLGACGPAGGFLLPGTNACLTLGGFARAEAGWRMTTPRFALTTPGRGAMPQGSAGAATLERSALGATARLTADVRLPTELGPLRAYVSLRGHNGGLPDRDNH